MACLLQHGKLLVCSGRMHNCCNVMQLLIWIAHDLVMCYVMFGFVDCNVCCNVRTACRFMVMWLGHAWLFGTNMTCLDM